jgi:tetratricopeptide (TPR) repeat protein
MLRLELLGTPNLTVSGRAVKLGAKHISMLAYLALEGRTSRRVLGNILWAEAPNALNNISVARNLVVKALGKDALEVDADSLELGKNVSCDVLEWRIGANQTDEAVWDLWRGGFLTGLRLTDWEMGLGAEFEDWLFTTRETLNLERREFASRLATLEVKRDLSTCASFLEVAATSQDSEPREDATRRLLLALGALGKLDQAAAVFSKLSTQLEEELGVEVTERTRAAFELVRTGETRACIQALEEELGSKSEAVTVIRSNSSEPFVGRAHDLELLHSTLEIQAKILRIAVISGEPGAGKSRLALEVSAALNAATIHVTFAPSSVPFTLLEALVRNNTDHLETLPSDWHDALARLAPNIFPNLPPTLPPELERRAVFNGARALLSLVGVLIVDDLQWADAASLEFLHFLTANPPENGLAMLGTLRSTEVAPEGVKTLLERIARIDLGVYHHITPLGREDLSELALAFNRQDIDAERLQASSGGNPFYALELLRSQDSSSSGRVHDLIKIRLEQLDETARQTLETLTITDNPSAPKLVQRVSGRSLEEFSSAITTLERANLLRVTTASLGFIHDLVRETVEMTTSSSRQTLLQLRAAREIREPVLSARHYWASNTVWDEEDTIPAVNSFLAFAAQSATRGDLNLGLTWFDRALEHSKQNDLRVRTLLERANALAIHGKHLEALAALDRADLYLELLDDVVLQARALVTRASLQHKELRRPDLAKENAKQALTLLGNLKGVAVFEVRADALTLCAMIAQVEAQNSEALELSTRALEIARTLQDRTRQANALNALGLAGVALNDPQAETYLLECLEIRERLGDVLGAARALNNLSFHYAAQNLPDESIHMLERALELQRRLGNIMDEAIGLANIGAIYSNNKQFKKAMPYYQNSIDLLERNSRDSLKIVVFNLAEVECNLGFLEQATIRLQPFLEGDNKTYIFVAALLLNTEIALKRGDTKLAKNQAHQALEKACLNNWSDLEEDSRNLLLQIENQLAVKPL